MPQKGAIFSLDSISKSFGEVQAVLPNTITLNGPGVFGLVGGNGAGKTTLLRLMSTVLPPDTGRISLNIANKKIPHNNIKRYIGVLPEGTGLYHRLTALENILYHARLHGISDKTAIEEAEKLAVLLNISSELRRQTKGFSKGMRQKIALIRSIIHSPPILLLDEPTSGLDVTAAREVRAVVKHMSTNEGKLIIYSTHYLDEAVRICDELIIMHNGEIVATGQPDELMDEHDGNDIENTFERLTSAQSSNFSTKERPSRFNQWWTKFTGRANQTHLETGEEQ